MEPYELLEAARQRMFGYRRDEHGEVIEGDYMWDPGSREVKAVMEQARLRMFGYCRNYQGKIVGSLEEAVEAGTQRQARLGAFDGALASWRYSTGRWTVACKACGVPLYQERGSYPQEKLAGEVDAVNAIREHRCK